MNWYELLGTDVSRVTGKQPRGIGMLKVLVHPSLLAVALYRLGHACYQRRLLVPAKFCQAISVVLTGCDIHPSAEIGERLSIGHPTGIVVGQGAKIGTDATIMQGVTVGKISPDVLGMPEIGASVLLGANAVILGPIHIGDDTGIGANCLVIEDVPARAIVVAEQARVLKVDGVRQEKSEEPRVAQLEKELARLRDELKTTTCLVEELSEQVRLLSASSRAQQATPVRQGVTRWEE